MVKATVAKIRVPTATEKADNERQEAWRKASVEKISAARELRVRAIESQEESIKRALDAYADLPHPSVDVPLRSDFIALRDPRELPEPLGGPPAPEGLSDAEVRDRDVRSRPGLTRLLSRRTNALKVELALLYAVHAEQTPGSAWRNTRSNASRGRRGQESWAVLSGLWAPRLRARRARINRALDDLAAADLVTLGPATEQGRYEGFDLLREDDSDKRYRLPKAEADFPAVVTLPAAFFRQGWHLVLSPAEAATWIVARHAILTHGAGTAEAPGVGLTQAHRWRVYGLSAEAYESIHELQEFGLLTIHDRMPHRRRGKFKEPTRDERARMEAEGFSFAPVPYDLVPGEPDVFDRPALTTVHACLLDPLPPRLRD
jgi:hypothetical protein